MRKYEDKKSDDEEDDDMPPSNGIFKKYTTSMVNKHEIYLSHNVKSDPLEHAELFNLLSEATDKDIITIHLDNNGGDADMGLRIARALLQSQATISVIVESNCYSAATFIALAGDYLQMQPGTYLMFHNYSGGFIGKGAEMNSYVKNGDESVWSQIMDICCPFLSQAEIKRLRTDQDLYVHAPAIKTFTAAQKIENEIRKKELVKRISRHFPAMKNAK